MLTLVKKLFRKQEKVNKPMLGTICSKCGKDIPNGTGYIKTYNGIPSWGSVKCAECHAKGEN
jgi:hypothetical protein